MRKRNHVIPVRLNAKELRLLDEQVKRSGLSREEFLRSLIVGAEVRAKPVSIMRICSGRWQGCATMPTSWPMWPMLPAVRKRRVSGKC